MEKTESKKIEFSLESSKIMKKFILVYLSHKKRKLHEKSNQVQIEKSFSRDSDDHI